VRIPWNSIEHILLTLSQIHQSLIITPRFTQIYECLKVPNIYSSRAMAQAVSRWLLTAEFQIRAKVCPCRICVVDNVALGQVFPFSFPQSVSFHRCFIFAHVSSGGWTMGPLAAQFHIDIVSPQRNNKKRYSPLSFYFASIQILHQTFTHLLLLHSICRSSPSQRPWFHSPNNIRWPV
jgi:hypothetical protein